MAYSNPFQAMVQQQMQSQMQNAGFQNFPGRAQRQQIDPQQFRQFAITLNDQSLSQFAQLARQQGISEKDIQDGINFIKSL